MAASSEINLSAADPTPTGSAAPTSRSQSEALAQRDVLEQHDVLRSARVSNIIAAHPDALALLIEGGFPLLAQAPLRWAMAHTVNLGQAFRIAGLEEAQQEALLSALVQLGVPGSLAGSGHLAMPDAPPDALPDALPDHEPEASFAPERNSGPDVVPESRGRH